MGRQFVVADGVEVVVEGAGKVEDGEVMGNGAVEAEAGEGLEIVGGASNVVLGGCVGCVVEDGRV